MSAERADRSSNTTGRSDIEIIVILALLAAIGPLAIDTYLPSMPAIAAEFGTTAAMVQQSISGYLLGLTVGQVICGPLSDRYGRRPLLLVGLAVFLIASVGCIYAPGIDALIGGRILQGLGCSATAVAGRAIIRDIWSGNRAARAMSFVMMVMAFAPLLAPIIGGQIHKYLGWRPVFWLMLGVGALQMALVIFRLPETNGPDKRQGVHLADSYRAYRHVLSSMRTWAYLLCGGLSYATMFAYIAGTPFVYITFFGIDPQYFGLLFGINVISLTLGNWLNSRYVTRIGYRRLMGLGAAISAAGTLALLVCSAIGSGGIVAVAATLFVAIGPISMVGANAISGAMNLYPRNAGAAAALFGVAQFGFGALAGVLVGVFFTGTPTAMALSMSIMAVAALLAWLPLRLVPGPGYGDPKGDGGD